MLRKIASILKVYISRYKISYRKIWNFGQETSNAIVLVGTKQQK